MDVEAIVREIRDLGLDYFGPVPEEDIEAAEREMGLTRPLPPTYRIFLRYFGVANTSGHQIAGLSDTRHDGPQFPYWDNVIDSSEALWNTPSRGLGVDRHLVFLTSNGGGIYYYLDTSVRDADGECPVIALGPGYPGIVVGANFLDFLRKLHYSEGEPVPEPDPTC